MNITVELIKPSKGNTVRYPARLLWQKGAQLLIHARWTWPQKDLGYVTFETGDHFLEHYYLDKWFNIFELRNASGRLKGWYCNVTRPARLENALLTSEDLELDLFVSADRKTILELDHDEFAARDLSKPDRRAALEAFKQLKDMARQATPPFDAALFSLGQET